MNATEARQLEDSNCLSVLLFLQIRSFQLCSLSDSLSEPIQCRPLLRVVDLAFVKAANTSLKSYREGFRTNIDRELTVITPILGRLLADKENVNELPSAMQKVEPFYLDVQMEALLLHFVQFTNDRSHESSDCH